MSKWSFLEKDILETYKTNKNATAIANKLFEKHKKYILSQEHLGHSIDAIRQHVKKYIKIQDHSALLEQCETVGIPAEEVKHYWHKGEHFSLFVKPEQATFEVLKDAMIEEMKVHAPKYPVIKRKKFNDDALLSVVDVADPHFGKYSSASETGDAYDISRAEARFYEGIEGLCSKMEREKIEKIVYVGGNDRLHTDNPFRTTTSGTKQDTDGMWYESYLSAKRCDVGAIERLLTIADVHFVFCPSNHDFMTGFFLADAIKSHFDKNKNITFDVSPMHRKYMQYGSSLIGVTHGDGCKEGDLSDLMKTECKKGWSISQYAYWYVHHLHHKIRKALKGSEKILLERDGKGITILNTGSGLDPTDYAHVEYLRSMSSADRWHFTNGFAHSPKAIEMFYHHKHYGQIGRYSHLF